MAKKQRGSCANTVNDEQRAAATEQLKRDMAGRPTRAELAKLELQNGADPKWVSVKYGVELERCLRYAKALDEQKAAKAERVAGSGG